MQTILRSGVVAGVIVDAWLLLLEVVVFHATTVGGFYQYVASAVLGMAAFSEGLGTVILGIAMHFAISIVFAAVYVFLAERIVGLRRPVPGGIAIGILAWVVMSFIVVPLSQAPKMPITALGLVIGFVSHVVFFGLPLAFTAKGAAARI